MTILQTYKGYFRFGMNFSLLILGCAIMGCASQPVELPPQATNDLANLRDQLMTARGQVQAATNSAKDLLYQPQDPITAQVQRLNENVAALNATRAQAREQAQSFQENTAAYFEQWDKTLNQMSTDTAVKGEERMESAKRSIGKLRQDIAEIRNEANPFMSNLNEATNYLATDTTSSGLKVIKPKLESAVNREPRILKQIDKLIADIDSMRSNQ